MLFVELFFILFQPFQPPLYRRSISVQLDRYSVNDADSGVYSLEQKGIAKTCKDSLSRPVHKFMTIYL